MNAMPLESVRDLLANLVGYLPTLVAGLLVLLLGLVVAWIGSRFLVRLLTLMRIDRVATRLGWGRALEKGDVRHSLFEMAGTVCGVLIFVLFLDSALEIWKLSMLSRLLERSVLFIPQLLVAAVILLIGAGVAAAVSRAVQRALHQEQMGRAQLVARIVRATIMLVTVSIVLVQLKIAVAIVTGAFLITLSALALSLALAFGLGSRRAVEMMWEERFRRREEERKKRAE